ncbi:dTDP-4-dehydrorhamnose reductase [Paenochrobactrum gallinarii]|uniref:dTDP-4-dehydrorhamnose reductase n=1 Tax=Paenochrobactrum gallinarii TaxID=643673 RepID=A0A841LVT4_9HYPH|nr:dTDP-4-dehydrorhamnose reductase [Paenochrobactrum gallinarii]MBB6262475.1 dTDP-4-dehydrorhamnose reductase [Paenochrobactrum gallinarii]
MKIAVTGKNGQVVRSLLTLADDKTEIIALGRPELDLAFPITIDAILSAINPDIIVSAAAYTAVDKAEDEPELAYAVNATGAGSIAEAADKLGIPIIHISTDYVFDGTKSEPYTELDEPNPQSVYGKSKLAGERLVANANNKHIILRTAWVYSPYGNNFLKTMLRLGSERAEISVVSDQHGNPTSAINIAQTILSICKAVTKENFRGWGIYHLVDDSETTWYHWAEYIFSCANLPVIVKPINGSDYPSKAQRPNNSRLSTEKLKCAFSCSMPNWMISTQLVIEELNSTKC